MTLHRRYQSPYFEARDLARSGRLKVKWHDWLGVAPPALPPASELADRIEGMLIGLAIGDALGNTSESMNPSARRASHGWIDEYLPNRNAEGRCVGVPSDDTQLAFRTLWHLVDHGGLEPQLLGNRFAAGRIYGIGQATRAWLGRFKSGTPWHASGTPAAGNGALMRIAPVLLPYIARPNCDLWADTLMAAHLTHDDELSNVSCVAFVDALWRAIGTNAPVPPGWWLDRWLQVAESLGTGTRYQARNGHPRDFDGTMPELLRRYVSPALEQELPVDEAGSIWHSGAYLLETVPTVIYILERYGNEPREAIEQAVNQTRDNDTVAAIVGAAVGALHGLSALPAQWVDGLTGRMAADDDHRIFDLTMRGGERFGYGSTLRVQSRAAMYVHKPPQDAAPEIPPGLLKGDLWLKVVGMLQQNWAVLMPQGGGSAVRIWFVDDAFKVFDWIDYPTLDIAARALESNGFWRFDAARDADVDSPIPMNRTNEAVWAPRRIYSSREYWVDPHHGR